MCAVGRCSESHRTGSGMASTAAFSTSERARKCRRSCSCSAYDTGCLSHACPIYGLPTTSRPPASQSIAPHCSPAGNLAATVAAEPAIHVSQSGYPQLHARIWRARSPGWQLFSRECSLSNVTIIYTNDRCFRRIKLSSVCTRSDSGRCAGRS